LLFAVNLNKHLYPIANKKPSIDPMFSLVFMSPPNKVNDKVKVLVGFSSKVSRRVTGLGEFSPTGGTVNFG
jgi:hypothetical protein